ncbi:MAG: diacylglycerol kinase family protein [Victivallales bacterium]
MKMLLILNPGSRAGKSKKMWEVWETGLEKAGVDFTRVVTLKPGHALEIASSPGNYDILIAAGGDGTINEVIDGAVQSGKENISVGILYSGTSPDFCRFHRIPIEPDKALAALLTGRKKKIDVARISYMNYGRQRQVSHFACGCNIGIGASVAERSNRMRKYTGDKTGTFIALLRAFMKNPRFNMELSIDGSDYLLEEVNNVSVLKNSHIASGLKLNLDIKAFDGRLSVMAVTNRGRLGLLKILPGLYTGNIVNAKDMFLKSCSTVKISSNPECEVEFDGDPKGFTPAHIEILPEKLNMIGGEYD